MLVQLYCDTELTRAATHTFTGVFRLYTLSAQLQPGKDAGIQTGHTWWAWLPWGLQVYLDTVLSCKETHEHVTMVM